jgi:hypothetical protein
MKRAISNNAYGLRPFEDRNTCELQPLRVTLSYPDESTPADTHSRRSERN